MGVLQCVREAETWGMGGQLGMRVTGGYSKLSGPPLQ